MSTFKKLTRINKDGGSMSAEEKAWFERKKVESDKFALQAKISSQKGV